MLYRSKTNVLAVKLADIVLDELARGNLAERRKRKERLRPQVRLSNDRGRILWGRDQYRDLALAFGMVN